MHLFVCLLLLVALVAPSEEEEVDTKGGLAISQCKCPTETVKQWLTSQQATLKKKKKSLRHKRADKNMATTQTGKVEPLCSKNVDIVIKEATRAKNFWISSEVTMKNNLQDLKERMERLVSLNERAVAEADAEVHVHIFKIQEFNQRKQKGDIVSAEYYTSEHGYKFNSKIYLNGKGRANGTHISLTVAVHHGDWDNILIWPVTVNFTFSIMDQRETRDKYHFTRHVNSTADQQQIAINQPTGNATEENRGIVVADLEKFALHSDLLNNKHLYLLKDTLFLKIKIALKRDEE